jgi:hypothetical protein
MATKKESAKPGRASKYTPELGAFIAERLSKGEPLAQICRDEGMPHDDTVRNWMAADEKFSQVIARARERGYDVLAADCLLIADTPQIGEETTTKPNGDIETKTGDMLGHRKLRIETRLKLLAKWDPKRYGDKLALSGDAENPLTILLGSMGKSQLPVVDSPDD